MPATEVHRDPAEWEVRKGDVFDELFAEGDFIMALPEDTKPLIIALLDVMYPAERTAFLKGLMSAPSECPHAERCGFILDSAAQAHR